MDTDDKPAKICMCPTNLVEKDSYCAQPDCTADNDGAYKSVNDKGETICSCPSGLIPVSGLCVTPLTCDSATEVLDSDLNECFLKACGTGCL